MACLVHCLFFVVLTQPYMSVSSTLTQVLYLLWKSGMAMAVVAIAVPKTPDVVLVKQQ